MSRSTLQSNPIRVQGDWIVMEALEGRCFFSAAPTDLADVIVKPALDATAAAGTTQSLDGYTPAQIRKAYGFDQLTLSNGVKGDGSGQTIAIVTAYDDPNISADLNTFSSQFGLGAANLKKVSQNGGSTSSIAVDGGWSLETALDVEWAHAIAPKANLLLVEAKTATLKDLLSAVDYARNASGVSVVSMSWGSDEFWGETSLDSHFTTPAGHTGVTFVAASGDGGSWNGPSWPSVSPNVLGVGGTSLNTSSSGVYSSETGWSGSGGGISQLVSEPSYQAAAQRTGARTTPDVSYNADPNTGFAVYSSVMYQGEKGWTVVGGTSAGTPQWAALVAIADQGRAANHLSTLDGATGTLPALYSLYSASSYANSFHDVASGWSSYFLRAHAGYDGVAGLGSPKAGAVVQALGGKSSSSTASTTTQRATVVAGGTTTANKPTNRATPKAIDHDAPPPSLAAAEALPAQALTPLALHHLNTDAVLDDTKAEVLATFAAETVASLSLGGNGDSLDGLAGTGRGVKSAFSDSLIPFTATLLQGQAEAMPLTTATIAAAGDAAEPAAEALIDAFPAHKRFRFARFDPMRAFSDAMSAFVDESAAITQAAVRGRTTAWAVTFSAVAIDVALIAYLQASRAKERRKLAQRRAAVAPQPWLSGRSRLA